MTKGISLWGGGMPEGCAQTPTIALTVSSESDSQITCNNSLVVVDEM
jgi:hypothetical protein